MTGSVHPRRGSGRSLLRYAAGWLLTGVAVAVVALAVIGGDDEDEVPVPPVREIELTKAAGDAGCTVRQARAGERLVPPVDGPPGRAARPGVLSRAPDPGTLTAATRRGIVVIQYRPGLARDSVERLRSLQEAVPAGTILTPTASRMPYEVAVTAHRRLLGCPRFSERTIDALQLFRGRYLGSGPDG
jgi:hypothetical protein